MGRPRRKYSKEFKAEVVKQVLEGGATMCEVARLNDMQDSVVHSWVKLAKAEARGSQSPVTVPTTPDEQEILRLRKALREAQMEIDFLKKCSAFFARHLPGSSLP